MKTKPTFKSAKLKIEWANHHIADLQRQVDRFAKENLNIIDSEADVGASEMDFTVSFTKEVPSEIALTIGDAIHNLRASLDHLAWELVGYDGGTQDRYLQFPIYHDRTHFEASCKGMKTPSGAIKDMFKAFEAFPGGSGHVLYVIHSLDNADKHTVLTPIIQVSTIEQLILRDPTTGDICRIPTVIATGGSKEGMVFSVSGFPPGMIFDRQHDAKITPEVLFGNVEFVKDKPVFPTLTQLCDATSNTIDIVERSIV